MLYSARAIGVAVVLLLALTCVSAATKGVLELDEVTFDKVVDGSKNVLVQVVQYTWKASDGYDKVATEFKDDPNLLVALVARNDNKDYVQKVFGIEKEEEMPRTYFYEKGSKAHQAVSSDDSDSLIEYVLFALNPKLKQLQDLAKLFIRSDKKADILKKAQDFVNKEGLQDSTYAKYYLASMKRINENGIEFLSKERERLQGLANNKATKKDKSSEFKKRLNVLNKLDSFKELQ